MIDNNNIITPEILQEKLIKNEKEILMEIYKAIKRLPEELTKKGIIEKKKEKKVAAIIKELLRNET